MNYSSLKKHDAWQHRLPMIVDGVLIYSHSAGSLRLCVTGSSAWLSLFCARDCSIKWNRKLLNSLQYYSTNYRKYQTVIIICFSSWITHATFCPFSASPQALIWILEKGRSCSFFDRQHLLWNYCEKEEGFFSQKMRKRSLCLHRRVAPNQN
jgi:hypothetical protein